MASENLALVIETSKRGTALQETIAEVGQLGQAAAVAEKKVGTVGTTMLQFPTAKTRQGAMAVREIAYAAESATLGGKAATIAFGNLAQTLALTSRNAKFAAMATELGALVLLATTLYGLIQKINKEPLADAATTARIGKADTLAEVQREYDRLRTIKQEAQKTAESGAFGSFEKLQQANANEQAAYQRLVEFKSKALEAARDKQVSADTAARARAEADERTAGSIRSRLAEDLFTKRGELFGKEFEAQRLAAERVYAAEQESIRALKISEQEKGELQQQAFQVRSAAIELIARAEQKAAAEERARMLLRVKEGLAGYQRLATAVRSYGGFAAKASQFVADAVRKFEILVQARKDAIKAKSEWAAGLASLGTPGGQGAAALHFAASAGYAAAAVAGGAEAMSGGGGGGSSGGGAGGAGQSTFEANAGRGGGDSVINIIVRDEFGRERIAQTRYLLDRSRELKVPLPTSATGLQMAS